MMIQRRLPAALILLGLIAAVAACSRSPKVNYYALAATAGPEVVTPVSRPIEVAIGPITLPDIVDRQQLVIQSKSHQVDILEFHRWAEPLKSQIPRLMADNVSRLLGSGRVSAYPQSAGSEADIRVLVDIQRFESEGEAVRIDAFWTLRLASGAVAKIGRTVARETAGGTDYDSLVTAYSKALYDISKEIAAALRSETPKLQ